MGYCTQNNILQLFLDNEFEVFSDCIRQKI